jgi:alcohol dehydrogenase (cytochrome c)
VPGQNTVGGVVWADRDRAFGALRAIDVMTGEMKWEFRYPQANLAGVLSTASGLVFSGDQEGNFIAFDAASGEERWHYQTGTSIWGAAAMTYLLDGRQQVLIASGSALFSFALPD